MFNVETGVKPYSWLCGLMCSAVTALSLTAAERPDRWIAILEGEPLAVQAPSREAVALRALTSQSARMAATQRSVRAAIQAKRGARVTGSVETLLHAMFFSGSKEVADEVRTIPGVVRVFKQRYFKHIDAKAADLVKATQAWAAAGGESNAGAGVKIGIVDSGIDRNHPSFQDPSLSMPSGYPKCIAEYCDAHTNTKIIAARSFVELLAFADSPIDSRPDDYTPRDRVGHGTAIASVAAGVKVQGPSAVVQGIAPKAYLGNYKVFGSPGVNEFATDEAVIRALEAAFNDGMDIVSISLGVPALWAPEDRDGVCGSRNVGPCDPQVDAVENAILKGMSVVIGAGNTGDTGLYAPGLGTINSPGTAPNAITVGGSTNSHIFYSTIRTLGGEDVPANLKAFDAQLTNGLKPRSPITAPLVDVSTLNDNGRACQPLGNGALAGAIALIQRGDCEFAAKIANAQNSGAVAVIFYQSEGSNFLFPIGNLRETGIPAVLIRNSDGKNLKEWLAGHAGTQVTIDPALTELDAGQFANEVAYFSSYGPSIGSLSMKPELVAVATDMYMATQTYDPNGDMHDPSGFFATQGTSFAAPQVAGVLALLKQRNPQMTPGQLKSAVVNTANPEVTDYDGNGQPYRARVVGVGAGLLDAETALRTNITVQPAAISFGVPIRNAYPVRDLRFTNLGTSAVQLRLEIQQRDADARARLNLSATTLSLGPGESGTVSSGISGQFPATGNYEGVIVVTGGEVPLRIPYMYMIGSNVPFNIIPLTGDGFVREPNRQARLDFLAVDQFGVPVVGRPVDFRVTSGGGRILDATLDTDGYGIASALVQTGNQTGYQEFVALIGSERYFFSGRNRQTPVIENGGIFNAASGQPLTSTGLAAGARVRITGGALSEASQTYSTPYLPLSLSNVSVSFDDTARKTSYAGRMVSVGPNEVVVMVPWELEGLDSIQAKVSIGYTHQTELVTFPVTRFAPGLFETTDAAIGRVLATATNVDEKAVTSENGVAPGEILHLVVNGLGPVNGRPASGDIPADPAAATTHGVPEVRIAGTQAEVVFSGLHPTIPGAYRVTVRVPEGVASGLQSVNLRIDGVEAKAVDTVIR
jgi:minor extracellular serine protease Vpr